MSENQFQLTADEIETIIFYLSKQVIYSKDRERLLRICDKLVALKAETWLQTGKN